MIFKIVPAGMPHTSPTPTKGMGAQLTQPFTDWLILDMVPAAMLKEHHTFMMLLPPSHVQKALGWEERV